MTRRAPRSRRGYALLSSFILTMVLLITGSALLGLAATSRRMAERRMSQAQALQLAMGGADHAVSRIEATGDFAGFQNRSLGAGRLTVAVVTPTGQAQRRVVTSTGTVTTNAGTVSRSVRAYVDTEAIPPIFLNGVVSRADMTLSGNVDVTSSPIANRGNIHSNGNLRLNGTPVDIYGRATATGTVTQSGHGTVTMGMQSGAAAVVFPSISQSYKELSLYNGSTTGNVTVSDGRLIEGKINGSLSIGAPNGCQVTDVVWVTGNLTVSGPITGTGTIVCDGTITINSSFAYPSSYAANVLLITTSTSSSAINLSGNSRFAGSLYAPNGGIDIKGAVGLDVLGGLYGNDIKITGRTVITYNTSFSTNPPPLPRLFRMRGWDEL